MQMGLGHVSREGGPLEKVRRNTRDGKSRDVRLETVPFGGGGVGRGAKRSSAGDGRGGGRDPRTFRHLRRYLAVCRAMTLFSPSQVMFCR